MSFSSWLGVERRWPSGNLGGVKMLTLGLLGLTWVLLAGCQTLDEKSLSNGKAVSEDAIALPFPEPEKAARELDEDLIYSYLVGEIGADRGELRLSQSHYLHAAILAKDAYAAERATRIALHLKDYESGLESVRLWVELAPNDMTARQIAAVLLLRNTQLPEAGDQLDALVKIADARGADGFLQAASVLSLEGDRDGAEQLIVELHNRHADDIRSLYAAAVMETAHGKLAEAEQHLRQVISEKPGWEQPRVMLTRVLTAQGRRDEAVELLADSVRRYPDSKLLRTTYSRTLIDVADYAGALGQFKALHRLMPDDTEITFGYAMLATQQESWDEARGLWQELRNDAERRDEASYYLAQIEEEAGNDALAIGLYRSVTGDELKVDAVMRMAQIYGRTDRLADAQEALQQARIANPNRAADLYIAETQVVQDYGSAAAALALYDLAIAAYPGNLDLRYNRGLFLVDQGDFAGMEQALLGILEEDPDHVDSLNALGYTLADRNERLDEAYGYIARALQLRPDSAAILDSMGWVLFRQGELEKAASYLRRALALSEQDDEIASHLGEVLWVNGDRDAARSVWKESLAHNPGSEKIREVVERLQVDL